MIVILNIDKPKKCGGCPCENDKNCQALDILKGECRENPTSSILTWSACPLIEIVRCGECIHHDDGLCHRPKWSFAVEPTDFCSHGERRSDEKSL